MLWRIPDFIRNRRWGGLSPRIAGLDTLDPREKHLIILDDLMDETDQRVASLFTKKSHYRNISVMYIVQNLFHRGKHHRTEELFTVVKCIETRPPVCLVKDDHGEILEGTFYAEEIQKVIKQDDVYKIQSVLKKRRKGRRVQYLVKWLGYPEFFNSWIFKQDLQKRGVAV